MSILEKKFGTNSFHARYLVDEKYDGQRLDQFLYEHLRNFSREQIKKKINKGECQIINRPLSKKSSSKLKFGDQVTAVIHRDNHEDEWWDNKKIKLNNEPDIIFKDQDIIVINKLIKSKIPIDEVP